MWTTKRAETLFRKIGSKAGNYAVNKWKASRKKNSLENALSKKSNRRERIKLLTNTLNAETQIIVGNQNKCDVIDKLRKYYRGIRAKVNRNSRGILDAYIKDAERECENSNENRSNNQSARENLEVRILQLSNTPNLKNNCEGLKKMLMYLKKYIYLAPEIEENIRRNIIVIENEIKKCSTNAKPNTSENAKIALQMLTQYMHSLALNNPDPDCAKLSAMLEYAKKYVSLTSGNNQKTINEVIKTFEEQLKKCSNEKIARQFLGLKNSFTGKELKNAFNKKRMSKTVNLKNLAKSYKLLLKNIKANGGKSVTPANASPEPEPELESTSEFLMLNKKEANTIEDLESQYAEYHRLRNTMNSTREKMQYQTLMNSTFNKLTLERTKRNLAILQSRNNSTGNENLRRQIEEQKKKIRELSKKAVNTGRAERAAKASLTRQIANLQAKVADAGSSGVNVSNLQRQVSELTAQVAQGAINKAEFEKREQALIQNLNSAKANKGALNENVIRLTAQIQKLRENGNQTARIAVLEKERNVLIRGKGAMLHGARVFSAFRKQKIADQQAEIARLTQQLANASKSANNALKQLEKNRGMSEEQKKRLEELLQSSLQRVSTNNTELEKLQEKLKTAELAVQAAGENLIKRNLARAAANTKAAQLDQALQNQKAVLQSEIRDKEKALANFERSKAELVNASLQINNLRQQHRNLQRAFQNAGSASESELLDIQQRAEKYAANLVQKQDEILALGQNSLASKQAAAKLKEEKNLLEKELVAFKERNSNSFKRKQIIAEIEGTAPTVKDLQYIIAKYKNTKNEKIKPTLNKVQQRLDKLLRQQEFTRLLDTLGLSNNMKRNVSSKFNRGNLLNTPVNVETWDQLKRMSLAIERVRRQFPELQALKNSINNKMKEKSESLKQNINKLVFEKSNLRLTNTGKRLARKLREQNESLSNRKLLERIIAMNAARNKTTMNPYVVGENQSTRVKGVAKGFPATANGHPAPVKQRGNISRPPFTTKNKTESKESMIRAAVNMNRRIAQNAKGLFKQELTEILKKKNTTTKEEITENIVFLIEQYNKRKRGVDTEYFKSLEMTARKREATAPVTPGPSGPSLSRSGSVNSTASGYTNSPANRKMKTINDAFGRWFGPPKEPKLKSGFTIPLSKLSPTNINGLSNFAKTRLDTIREEIKPRVPK